MPAIVLAASGFVAGVLAGLSLSPRAWPLWPAAAVVAAAGWPSRRRTSVVCLALAAGGPWGAAAVRRAALTCPAWWHEGERVALMVEPWDLPSAGRRSAVRVREPARCRGTTLRVLWPRGAAPPRGPSVVVGTWLGAPDLGGSAWPARPGAGSGVVARHVRALPLPPSLRSRARLAAQHRLLALFGEERFPLVSALTLGSSGLLDRGVRAAFARAGVAHLLAISGLHVAILAAALVALLRLAGVAPAPARRLALPALVGYLWLLGAPPPALRAVSLLLVWEAARWRQRPPLRSGVLAVTALGVVALDPFAVSEPGPWLSFAGAWGAAEGARWWSALPWRPRWREHRLFAMGALAAVSLGATLATAPLGALAFGTVGAASVVTNLLAVPIMGVAVPALALALGLGLAGTAAAALPAAAAGLLLDLLERVASIGGALPFAQLAVTARAGTALLLVGTLWLWRRIALPRRRAPYRGIVRWRVATAAATLGAAAVWTPLVPRVSSGFRPGVLEIDFLAVGQGDATALRTPAGRWVVVDGGPRAAGRDAGASIVVPFLRRRGVRRLALVVASHGEADHVGGLPAVLRAFHAELALEPGQVLATAIYREWLAEVARDGVRWHPARAGDSVAVDGVVLRVLHPDSAWMALGLETNENAVVLRVEYGGFRAILPGDAGLPMEAERSAGAGPATLLKVAHHGSRSATGDAWLRALAPRLCVVSVGVNRFGHPAPDVLAELEEAGCRVWRTDRDGSVTVATDGRTAWVRSRRGAEAFPLDNLQGATW